MRRRTKFIAVGGVLLAVAGGAFALTRGQAPLTMTTETVKRLDLVQTVEVTGKVEADKDVDLAFGTSGVVKTVNVKVGSVVRVGQLLATLNVGALQAAYVQAEQALAEAEANLAKAQAGITSEETGVNDADVAVAESALAQAQLQVEQTKASTADAAEQTKEDVVEALRSLVAEIRQALADADTVLGVENPLFNQSFDDILSAEDVTALSTAEASFEQAAKSRDAAEAALAGLSGTDAAAVADLAEVAYTDCYQTLVDTARVLDATSANTDSLSLDDLLALKARIAAAESTLVADGSALQSARQAAADADRAMAIDVAAAEAVVSSRQADVDRAKAAAVSEAAAPREVDTAALQAAVGQAKANLSGAAARLRDAQIIAPIAGTVTAVSIDPGESATALSAVITVVSFVETYAITLNVPEADVAKVAVGQSAAITFDAFGDDRLFQGTVGTIDPAQTVIEDVVFYQAKVFLNEGQDLSAVKPGMSATVTITTATKPAVLAIPSRAVLEKNGTKYVRIPDGKSYKEQTVTVGLRADGGLIEIVDGLSEGETVIVAIKS